MAAQKKKSFTDDLNPVMQFITPAAPASKQPQFESITHTEAVTAPDENGEQIRFVYATPEKERKSRRVQLLMRPSLYDSIKAEAEAHNASVNDYIDAILTYHIKGAEK